MNHSWEVLDIYISTWTHFTFDHFSIYSTPKKGQENINNGFFQFNKSLPISQQPWYIAHTNWIPSSSVFSKFRPWKLLAIVRGNNKLEQTISRTFQNQGQGQRINHLGVLGSWTNWQNMEHRISEVVMTMKIHLSPIHIVGDLYEHDQMETFSA